MRSSPLAWAGTNKVTLASLSSSATKAPTAVTGHLLLMAVADELIHLLVRNIGPDNLVKGCR